jgi:hypothetical protein
MESRAESSLQHPDPGRDYSDFPCAEAGSRWYRADENGRESPWWFSSAAGRYNLHSPRGTLNTASSPETALREKLGPTLLSSSDIPEAAVEDQTVFCLEIPKVCVADFLHSAAATFGVLAGDATGPVDEDYNVTRDWALTLDNEGFEGIRARSRCGSGPDPLCLYVFGDEGIHIRGDVIEDESQSARSAAANMTGYAIVPRPDSDSLIIDP